MSRRNDYSPAYPAIWPVIAAYGLCVGSVAAYLVLFAPQRSEVRVFLADQPEPATASAEKSATRIASR